MTSADGATDLKQRKGALMPAPEFTEDSFAHWEHPIGFPSLPYSGHGDCFTHNDPDDPARHMGWGQPLVGTSWLNRPYYTSLLLGGMIADDAIDNQAELSNGFLISLHQGYDFDHYYGTEARFTAAQLNVINSPTDDTDNLMMIDVRLLHYPWGDSLWRPYYSVGIGFAHHSLTDIVGIDHSETLVNVPLGIGLKYQWKRHCAMRFDITHNFNFGSGPLDTMDNVSITAGAEWRYGGVPKSYYPWNPSLSHK